MEIDDAKCVFRSYLVMYSKQTIKIDFIKQNSLLIPINI